MNVCCRSQRTAEMRCPLLWTRLFRVDESQIYKVSRSCRKLSLNIYQVSYDHAADFSDSAVFCTTCVYAAFPTAGLQEVPRMRKRISCTLVRQTAKHYAVLAFYDLCTSDKSLAGRRHQGYVAFSRMVETTTLNW